MTTACGSSSHGDDDDSDSGAGGETANGGTASGGRAGRGGTSTAGGVSGVGTGGGSGSSGTSGGTAGDGGTGASGGATHAGESGQSGESGESGGPASGAGGGGAGEPLGVLDLSGLEPSVLGYPAVDGVEAARARAEDIVAELDTSELLALVHGDYSGSYIGNVPPVGPLPALGFDDGPAGVGNFTRVTAFPAPITFAASWDRALVRRWGSAMGAEMRGKGVAVQLGPMINLARVPLAGRNFESFGEDPYLSAELVAEDVRGIQENGVVATAKHFVGNEQETNRETENSVIDERTLHEVYYAPFEASVAAGVGAVMCSYNRLNGEYACENPTSLGDLRGTLGFSGWVMSDWGATHSGEKAARAGLDMEMPTAGYFTSLAALGNDPLLLQGMATRIVTSLVRVGVVDNPPAGSQTANVRSDEHTALAREGATAGITLLKNENRALPLGDDVTSIAVIGTAGRDSPLSGGAGAAAVIAPYISTAFDALSASAPGVTYDSGAVAEDAAAAASAADAAIVVLAVASGEFSDRATLSLTASQDALVATVAAANPRTIVVLNTPGVVMMPWLDSVAGLVAAWYPGQENGNALASVLLGDTNPSGKLPVTFPKGSNTLPSPGTTSTVEYTEGLAIGHRWFDQNDIEPLFEFGFGLSYTTFGYGALELYAGSEPGSVDVAFELTNTGPVSGTEVAQLYLTFPAAAGEPPRILRGFERVTLAAGATKTVHIVLPPRAFGCWNPTTHARFAPSGEYVVAVGSSSRTLPLEAPLTVIGLGTAP